ncbi:sodium/hydrogen exchanger 6, partial [Clarias magur]
LLVGVVLRYGVNTEPNASNATGVCVMEYSPASLVVNVSGRFYEYTLRGEVNEGDHAPNTEILRK